MNTSDPGSAFTFTFTSDTENVTLTAAAVSPSTPQPPTFSPHVHNPELTIVVVLGLSLLLAGLAAFLAVCRPSDRDGDSEAGCGPGESLTRGKNRSGEPQLKVWKRLGSYRRSYNISFRRPPPRRPCERAASTTASQSPARQTSQPAAGAEPHLTMPCLFDYVTEI